MKNKNMLITSYSEAGCIKTANFYMQSYGCKIVKKPYKGKDMWPWECIITHPFPEEDINE